MITMDDIAQRAGVSRATVSLVINGRTGEGIRIPDETRQRVLGAAAEMGYRANSLARSVASGKTRMLGFLVMCPDYEPYWRTLIGSTREAEAHGYTVKLFIASPETMEEQVRACAELRLAGLIVRYDREQERDFVLREARQMHMPVALVDDGMEHSYGTRVLPDDRHGCALAVSHLCELGHRRIGVVSIPIPPAQKRVPGLLGEREEGFRQALQQHGLEIGEDLIARDAVDYGRGEEAPEPNPAIERLLDHPQGPPTAVLTYVDHAALGVMAAARRRGWRVPHDLSVVGFSDFAFARYVDPPLSTVISPWEEMGREAVRLLLARSSQRFDRAPDVHSVPPRFVVRRSTAPACAGKF